MAGPAVIFREIHRLRRFARDLQEQLDRIPRLLKAHQAKVVRAEEAHRQAKDEVRHWKVKASDGEKALKAKHGDIARFEKQRDQAGSTKEYEALGTEIHHAREKCDEIENEVLAAMEEGEKLEAALPGLEKAAQQAREELVKAEQESAPRKESLTAQLNETTARLQGLEAEIPPDHRAQYNRTVSSLGADGMAAVSDRACTACYTEITAKALGQLQQEEFVVCKSCGRILYLPEAPARSGEEDEE
jgi:predicted  nucleic acid-binding Zn-ribbon protein